MRRAASVLLLALAGCQGAAVAADAAGVSADALEGFTLVATVSRETLGDRTATLDDVPFTYDGDAGVMVAVKRFDGYANAVAEAPHVVEVAPSGGDAGPPLSFTIDIGRCYTDAYGCEYGTALLGQWISLYVSGSEIRESCLSCVWEAGGVHGCG